MDSKIMSAFYLDVREEDGIYQIFTIENVKDSKSHVVKLTVPEANIR
jgi:truncated hemoglobin YjbI